MLKHMKTDGTWDQGLQAERIKRKANNSARSIDLSNATDRFPIDLQYVVVRAMLNKTVADHWKTIMTSRAFHYDNTHVEYRCGQPMGLYSSWAVFAFTHHALIEYLAHLEGFHAFRDYAVLGDDVVIWNETVASKYIEFLDNHEIKWSPEKTISSDADNIRVEFAKRLFLNGIEITPLNPRVILAASKSLYDLPQLLDVLEGRGWSLNESDIVVPGFITGKGVEYLQILSAFRATGSRTPKFNFAG